MTLLQHLLSLFPSAPHFRLFLPFLDTLSPPYNSNVTVTPIASYTYRTLSVTSELGAAVQNLQFPVTRYISNNNIPRSELMSHQGILFTAVLTAKRQHSEPENIELHCRFGHLAPHFYQP